MFYLDFGDFQLFGASPEVHVKVRDGRPTIRPLAGTRRRGANAAEDAALEKELLADPKERAEHLMLVDLARNDLGRVCAPGTVEVTELMEVERYSHVMHIVSNVEGKLADGQDGHRRAARHVPRGHRLRRPEDPGHRGHRFPGAGDARVLRGVVAHVESDGSLDSCISIRCAPEAGGHRHAAGGRRHRVRLGSARKSSRKRKQSSARWRGHSEWRRKPMYVIIDNYDSFTHNLYQYLRELTDKPVEVFRNDRSRWTSWKQ